MGKKINKKSIDPQSRSEDNKMLIELAKESMAHVRHSQTMRVTYLNLYLAFYGVAAAGFVAIWSTNGIAYSDKVHLSWFIGAVVWFFGLIVVSRSERWSGHIVHDLIAFSRLRSKLVDTNSILLEVFTTQPRLNPANDFSRPPWHPRKSIDSLVGIIGAMSGVLPYLIIPSGELSALFRIACILPLVAPWGLWKYEVNALEENHKICCFQEGDK